ncbi:hypothetical protein Scep_028649 [Stephania cephalantha]|uniref:Uncharacterized protein n=1 Tax=Stephania cephalantha TaxID=152367 RepID=A0AAP0EEX5_9MAGN
MDDESRGQTAGKEDQSGGGRCNTRGLGQQAAAQLQGVATRTSRQRGRAGGADSRRRGPAARRGSDFDSGQRRRSLTTAVPREEGDMRRKASKYLCKGILVNVPLQPHLSQP